MDAMAEQQSNAARIREINDSIRYTMWSVFRLAEPLGDGVLASEADRLDQLVDLMRHLRGSETRRHVREEVPFYTGALTPVAELVDRLP